MHVQGTIVPSRGDRVAQHRTGVTRVGHVWYADTAGSREVARRQLELSAHRSRLVLRTARRVRRS
jgi:hypothetical protein